MVRSVGNEPPARLTAVGTMSSEETISVEREREREREPAEIVPGQYANACMCVCRHPDSSLPCAPFARVDVSGAVFVCCGDSLEDLSEHTNAATGDNSSGGVQGVYRGWKREH